MDAWQIGAILTVYTITLITFLITLTMDHASAFGRVVACIICSALLFPFLPLILAPLIVPLLISKNLRKDPRLLLVMSGLLLVSLVGYAVYFYRASLATEPKIIRPHDVER